eukprot:SAG11_NODE_13268_length_662_cov_1.095915_1_plen_140_part_10
MPCWCFSAGYEVGTCFKAVLQKKGIGNQELVYLALSTLCVEIFLGFVAYHMIVDVDVKAEKKAASRKGGAQIGTIRGVIVGGSALRSGNDAIPKAKRKNKFSSRYAVLTLKAPAVHNKEHRVQSVRTELIEDDSDPASIP